MNKCTRCNGTGCEPTTPLDQTQTARPCESCKGTGTITGWKVGDEIVCIPAGDGWVYISKETAEHMGIDRIAEINDNRRNP